MKSLIWLDDYRNPLDPQVDWLVFSPIGRNINVIWLKTFNAFTNYIDQYGLPDAICFDHDLGESGPNEHNGYDCAKYVVDYCIENDLDIPVYNIQSANPIGADNIRQLMNNYHTYYIKQH